MSLNQNLLSFIITFCKIILLVNLSNEKIVGGNGSVVTYVENNPQTPQIYDLTENNHINNTLLKEFTLSTKNSYIIKRIYNTLNMSCEYDDFLSYLLLKNNIKAMDILLRNNKKFTIKNTNVIKNEKTKFQNFFHIDNTLFDFYKNEPLETINNYLLDISSKSCMKESFVLCQTSFFSKNNIDLNFNQEETQNSVHHNDNLCNYMQHLKECSFESCFSDSVPKFLHLMSYFFCKNSLSPKPLIKLNLDYLQQQIAKEAKSWNTSTDTVLQEKHSFETNYLDHKPMECNNFEILNSLEKFNEKYCDSQIFLKTCKKNKILEMVSVLLYSNANITTFLQSERFQCDLVKKIIDECYKNHCNNNLQADLYDRYVDDFCIMKENRKRDELCTIDSDSQAEKFYFSTNNIEQPLKTNDKSFYTTEFTQVTNDIPHTTPVERIYLPNKVTNPSKTFHLITNSKSNLSNPAKFYSHNCPITKTSSTLQIRFQSTLISKTEKLVDIFNVSTNSEKTTRTVFVNKSRSNLASSKTIITSLCGLFMCVFLISFLKPQDNAFQGQETKNDSESEDFLNSDSDLDSLIDDDSEISTDSILIFIPKCNMSDDELIAFLNSSQALY